ncbi:MAG TPA: hypothetical protein VJK48_02890 [Chlamydiales bacterium]|nr:hypothetical protein [Chlamydiales bacterium]
MAMPINIKSLPIITWSVGEKNQFEVKSIKKDSDYREFQLIENGTVISSAILKVRDIGYCFQRWIRKDESNDFDTRMFVTEKKQDIYFVAVSLKHREIKLYSQAKPWHEEQWIQTAYSVEPFLEKNFWEKVFFPNAKLSNDINWRSSAVGGGSQELCRKSYDKSELGLTRKGRLPTGQIYEDRVIYATRAKLAGREKHEKRWTLTRVSQRTIEEKRVFNRVFVGEFLDPDSLHLMNGSLLDPFELRDGQLYIGGLSPDNLWYGVCDFDAEGGDYTIAFNTQRPLYTNFARGLDLSRELHERIKSDFVNSSLHYVEEENRIEARCKQNSVITVSSRMNTFADGNILPVVRIDVRGTRFGTFLGSLRSLIPALSSSRREADYRLYGTKISQDLIMNLLLDPDSMTPADRKAAIEELNRAYERSATVSLTVSFDRTYAEIHVDQSLYFGCKLRGIKCSGDAPLIQSGGEEARLLEHDPEEA